MWDLSFITVLFYFIRCSLAAGDDEVFLTFPLGTIKGKTRTTITGVTLYSFQGIPFVEPPIGEYRFQMAKEKEPWKGVLDVTEEKSMCLQMTSDTVVGEENCLFMNIFTPKNPSLNASLPVMVYIHGGGFRDGSSKEVNYGPDHLMNYDVIFVSFNYRLGPFGFLSTGDKVIPGNAGLKDQLQALRFVKKYIKYFGGDPDKITIFGLSAGSASVQYHVLNSRAKGLFRGAICESGSVLSAWASQRNQTEISYLLVSLINPEMQNASSTEVYEYLKQLPAEQIDRAAYKIAKMDKPSDNQIQQGFYFAPVIEPEHEDAIITKSMFELVKNGEFNTDVKLLIGVNSEESLYYVSNEANPVDTNFIQLVEEISADNTILIPRELNCKQSDRVEVAAKIKEFYSPYLSFNVNWRSLIKYFSDQSFARSSIKAAELFSHRTDVYFYEFMYHGVLGGYVNESVVGFSEDVRHGEEVGFILRSNDKDFNNTNFSKYPENDQLVQKRIIRMWTDFVKYLNPTPEPIELLQNITWPMVKPNDFQYLAIGAWSEVRRNPKSEMYLFWSQIFDKYGVEPFTSW